MINTQFVVLEISTAEKDIVVTLAIIVSKQTLSNIYCERGEEIHRTWIGVTNI